MHVCAPSALVGKQHADTLQQQLDLRGCWCGCAPRPKPTRRMQLKQVVGSVGDRKLAAILAPGARIEDVAEAKALTDGNSDVVGQGEQVIRGPAEDVVTILISTGT